MALDQKRAAAIAGCPHPIVIRMPAFLGRNRRNEPNLRVLGVRPRLVPKHICLAREKLSVRWCADVARPIARIIHLMLLATTRVITLRHAGRDRGRALVGDSGSGGALVGGSWRRWRRAPPPSQRIALSLLTARSRGALEIIMADRSR